MAQTVYIGETDVESTDGEPEMEEGEEEEEEDEGEEEEGGGNTSFHPRRG